jgi:tetratricopeptide (TPR) repeat protein
VIAASVAGLALAALLGAPWLAERDVQAAARVWPTRPGEAFARLDRAAALNPLSDRARLIAGGIALRLGDLRRADREFAAALDRNPGGEYATLERGAIASQLGDRAAAVALLGRAVTLSPRDPLAALALRDVRAGQTIDVMALNRSILTKAAQLRRSSG